MIDFVFIMCIRYIFFYFQQTMKKYGKKITLTENEIKAIQLGYVHSHKQTESYKKAVELYKEECATLLNEWYKLDTKTCLFFDESEFAVKMLFVIVQSKSNVLDVFDEFLNDFLDTLKKGNK